MKTTIKVIMIFSAMLIASCSTSFANISEEPSYVSDLANIVDTKDEEKIYLYAEKLDLQTNTKLYINTLESKDNGYGEADNDILKDRNSIVINYFKDDGIIEVKAGGNLGHIITDDLKNEIIMNDIVQGNIKTNLSDGIRYLYLKVADEILISNGFESIIKTEEALEQNKKSKIIFYIIAIIAILSVLFFTPISPYQKRKKNAKSIYMPPSSSGGGFYGGGQTLGGDFTGSENKKK